MGAYAVDETPGQFKSPLIAGVAVNLTQCHDEPATIDCGGLRVIKALALGRVVLEFAVVRECGHILRL